MHSFSEQIPYSIEAIEMAVVVAFAIITTLLTIITLIESYRATKYKKLYKQHSAKLKLQTRLRRTYEEELKTFANLMDEITFPIWQRDKNMDIIYCNSRFCEIVGEIRDNVLKDHKIELFRSGRDFSKKAFKTSQTQIMEQNIIINGNNTLNQVVEIPISDNSSQNYSGTGTIGFAINFAELQSTRERLRHSVELQKRLLETLASAVVVYGPNQQLEYYNKSFVDLWKFDEEWLQKMPTYGEVLDVLREKRKLPEQADFTSFKKENLEMFSNLINKKEDYYYLTDGTVLKVVVIPYEQRGLLFYYEDMTMQLNLERDYNTVVSVQKHTLDNLNEAVAVFGSDGRLKLYNPAYLEFWGHSKTMLDSEPHIKEVLEEEKPLHSYSDWEEFKNDCILHLSDREITEIKVKRQDGIVLFKRFTPLPDGATLLTYLDITDKENVENSLRAEKTAFEEADKLKTNFLNNVSYELRSPLTSIMGFAEFLMMGYAKFDDKAKEYIGAIFDSSVKLKQLIDNIIDVSSIDAGYISLNRRNENVKEVVKEIIPEIREFADESNVTINCKISKNIKTGFFDRERIKKVFKMLMTNAIIMSKEGSEVILKISRGENEKSIKFEVKDTGMGIPSEDLPLIFDEFYKIEADTEYGTGLGLYLSKKIIEMHGGYITVESEIGKGSNFIFEIPVEDKSVDIDLCDPKIEDLKKSADWRLRKL